MHIPPDNSIHVPGVSSVVHSWDDCFNGEREFFLPILAWRRSGKTLVILSRGWELASLSSAGESFESLWPVSGGMRERAKERKEVREETAHHRNLRGKTEREKGGEGIRSDSARGV